LQYDGLPVTSRFGVWLIPVRHFHVARVTMPMDSFGHCSPFGGRVLAALADGSGEILYGSNTDGA